MGRNKIHNETKAEYASEKNKEIKYCEHCNKDISYYAWNKHIRSKKHLELSKDILNDKKEQNNNRAEEIFETLRNWNKTNCETMNQSTLTELMKKIDDYQKVKKELKYIQ